MLRRAFVYVVLAGVCAWSLLPLAWAVCSAVKPLDEVYRFPPTFLPHDWQWSNVPEALHRLPMLRFLANSLLIAVTSALGAVISASMAGYALARLRFPGRRCVAALVLTSILIPAPVLLVPRFVLFDLLGWVGTYKPLIVPAWLGGGAFNILLFRQYFRTIPREYDEAALLEGASFWQIYRHVLVPLSVPALATAGVLSFVFHWHEFLDPLIYLSDFSRYPVSLGLRMYQSTAGTWANLLMAASLLALVPLVVAFIIGGRWITGVLGAVTGPQE
jgi:multiple sugar transport system permease protein